MTSPEPALTASGPAVSSQGIAGRMGRHTAIYLGGLLVGRIVSFAMLPFYTHYLSPADYGIMQLLEMTLDIISIVAGARIAAGIHRYYYKAETEEERHSVVTTAFLILAISFVVLGLVAGLLARPLTTMVLGSPEHADLMRIASVTLALQSLVIVPFAVLQLERRAAMRSGLSIFKLFVQLTLNIVLLAYFGLGVKGVFLSTMISTIVMGVIVTGMLVRRFQFRFSRSVARLLLQYGVPLVGTQFAIFFVTYGDRYFLRINADVTSVGLYGLAYQFGFIVTFLGYAPFSLMWEPTRFQLATRPDRDALYARAFVVMNMLLLTTAMGCAVFVRDFILVMSDAAYHSAYRIVPVILVAYVLQCWTYFHEVGILLKERTGFITIANWIAALVALGGYVLLVPRWLGWGAAITTAIAFLARWVMTYAIAQRLTPIRYEWGPVTKLLALALGFGGLGIVLPHPSIALSLAMRVPLVLVYFVCLWNAGVIYPEEKQRVIALVRNPRQLARSMKG